MNPQTHTPDPLSDAFLYLSPPSIQVPKRYDIVKYSTWRMRLYQELESIPVQELKKKQKLPLNQLFPKLSQSDQEKQFFDDFLSTNPQKTKTHQQELLSYFICRMLYSRTVQNQDIFIKIEKNILCLKMQRMKVLGGENDGGKAYKMRIIKGLIAEMIYDGDISQLHVTKEEFELYGQKITFREYANRLYANEHSYMKIPYKYGYLGIRKRRSFLKKGYVYVDVQNAMTILQMLYMDFTRERMNKTRKRTEKFLETDIENQLKPFMDKAISSITSATIDQSQLNSEFRLTLKNIDAVGRKYFPPCVSHLNQKLKENGHLRHDGRRQLWLFLKECGMSVEDNKEYIRRHMQLKVSNSDLKSHMYNIEHAYGLVGKKEKERAKNCRGIITGSEPKSGEYHGCPFAHWGSDKLEEYLLYNYQGLNRDALKEVMSMKKDNYFQAACGRLFEAVNKPQNGSNLPEEITSELGKSPHQFFIAGMIATEWMNTKTLKLKNNKRQIQNVEIQGEIRREDKEDKEDKQGL